MRLNEREREERKRKPRFSEKERESIDKKIGVKCCGLSSRGYGFLLWGGVRKYERESVHARDFGFQKIEVVLRPLAWSYL